MVPVSIEARSIIRYALVAMRSDNHEPLDDYQIINRLRERNRQLLIKLNQLKQLRSQPQPTDQEIKRKHRGVLAS